DDGHIRRVESPRLQSHSLKGTPMRLCSTLSLLVALLVQPILAQSYPTATTTTRAALYVTPSEHQLPFVTVSERTVLRLLQPGGDWLLVEFDDPLWGRRTGYVRQELVMIADPYATQAKTPSGPSAPQVQPASASAHATAPTTASQPKPPTNEARKKARRQQADTNPGRSASERPKNVTIRGYVTNVLSPTTFEIKGYRITRDAAFVLDFENVSPELNFRPETIRVGVGLQIKG